MAPAFFFLFFSLVSGLKYIGCYKDSFREQRDMSGALFISEALTPDFCETKCGSAQYKFFGLQYGTECWCGNSYGKHGSADDKECDKKCGGDENKFCGGGSRNSVYEVTKEFPPLIVDKNQPLLALVMIVKDEAHTLPTTLPSLKPYIDSYFILDTGSTDGTPDVIRQTLGTENGRVFQEPFIDYGASRNRIIELASNSENPPVFLIMLSADETIANGQALRDFLEANRGSVGEGHEAYSLQIQMGGSNFDTCRIVRVSAGWRYLGRVHEYLASPDKKYHSTNKVTGAKILFRSTDDARRDERQKVWLKILLEEKERDPTDIRTSYYLAQTFDGLQRHQEALDEYRRRVSLGGFPEEVFKSLYAIGWQMTYLKKPWHEIQQAFLDAYHFAPGRAEPLYCIAEHYFQLKKFALAYLFARRAVNVPYPADAVLGVLPEVYNVKIPRLLALAAKQLGSWNVGAMAAAKAWKNSPRDTELIELLKTYKRDGQYSHEAWILLFKDDIKFLQDFALVCGEQPPDLGFLEAKKLGAASVKETFDPTVNRTLIQLQGGDIRNALGVNKKLDLNPDSQNQQTTNQRPLRTFSPTSLSASSPYDSTLQLLFLLSWPTSVGAMILWYRRYAKKNTKIG